MTDIVTPDIVEIAPADNGLNPMQGDGPEPKVDDAPKPDAKAEKPSIDDSIKKALDASKAKETAVKEPAPAKEPVDDKAKPEVKAETVKETVADKAIEEKARPDRKQSESRKFDTAPSRMLPEASVKWMNTPTEIREEVHRVLEDVERERTQYAESHKFREELKEYEELGKQHNVTVKQALDNYVGIERKFKESPPEGFKQLLTNMQIDPQQAITHILQAYNVTPQTLASHIAQNPQAYAPQVRQQAQNVPDPISPLEQKITALEQKIAQQEQSAQQAQIMPVINSFVETHPDYYDLEPKIAEILKSGIIIKMHGEGLPPGKMLSEAYRMAGGSLSLSRSESEADIQHSPATPQRPVNPDAGKLSIGGAPNAGDIKSSTRKKTPPSIDDALKNAIRRAS